MPAWASNWNWRATPPSRVKIAVPFPHGFSFTSRTASSYVGARTTAGVVGQLEQEATAGQVEGGPALQERLVQLLADIAKTGTDTIDVRRRDGGPTVIMAVDHFMLPRWFRISRPLDAVPAWEQTRFANWPAIVALLVAVIYGAIASAILPGSLGYDSPRNWGPVPLECWLLAGVLYTVLVAVTRTVDARELLAFPRHLDDRAVESPAVIDVASGAAPAPTPAAPSAQPSWT